MLPGVLQACQLKRGTGSLPLPAVGRQRAIDRNCTVGGGIILQLLSQQMQEELLQRLGC